MKLKKIDLTKGIEHSHPDLRCDGTYYLVDWSGHLIVGTFSKVWFGLNFEWFWGASSIQFDAPGFNSSGWRKVWEIIEYKTQTQTECSKCGRSYTSLGYCVYCG